MGCSDAPTPVFIETNLGTRLAVPASPDITAEDFKKKRELCCGSGTAYSPLLESHSVLSLRKFFSMQGEVERAHLNCFPEFGDIRVKAVMVKQKSRYYHLSKFLPLKYAFQGSNVTWFLQTCVTPLNFPDHVGCLKYNDSKVHNLNSAANVITDSVELGGFTTSSYEKRMKCKRKNVKVQRSPYLKASVLKISALSYILRKRKRKIVKRNCKTGLPRRVPTQHSLIEKEMLCRFATRAEKNWSKKSHTDVIVEAISETISEPASVSGIIKKYFSDYDEVASTPEFPFTTVRQRYKKLLRSNTECKYLNMQSGLMSPVAGHIPPQVSQDLWLEKPCSEALIEKHKTPDVGKRLLLASNGFRLSPSNRKSILSLVSLQ